MKKIKKIKTKLLLAFGAVLFISLLLSGWSVYSIYKILDYEAVNVAFDGINTQRMQLREAEKNFLLRDVTRSPLFEKGESLHLSMFKKWDAPLKDKVDSLSKNAIVKSLGLSAQLDETKKYLSEYTTKFYLLTEKIKKRGFKDWGDEGELRKAIHAVEKDKAADRALILELRKHEKDFFLRKDIQYKAKFDKAIEALKGNVISSDKDNSLTLEEALKNIDTYQSKFHEIIEAEIAIGLTENDGLLAEMQTSLNKLDLVTLRMTSFAKAKIDEVVSRTILLIVLAVLVQLALGTVLAISFANDFTKNTVKIRDSIVQLADGTYPEETKVTTVDEFGESQLALNNLIERVKTATDFADKVGNGELSAKYNENFIDDVLAKALLNMHGKLIKAANEEERRTWATQGLANFGELLRNEQDFRELSNKVISYLVKYLGANQGALFIVNEDNNSDVHLELSAAYAWGRQKFVEKRIGLGEGVAGQAWQEGHTIYLKEVPSNYVKITSGLGGANPRSILVVPLKVDKKIFGVIELASFKTYEKFEIALAEKLAESTASAISSVKITEHTKGLLAHSQQQAEELRAQEEEMRQNMEELSATQEEISRRQLDNENVIKAIDSSFAVVEFEPTGVILNANQNFATLMGYSISEIKGRHHRMFVDGETKQSSDYLAFWSNLANGVEQKGKFKRINKQGDTVWINGNYTPMCDKAGKVTKIMKVAFDLTSAKQNEMKLMNEIGKLQKQLEGVKGTSSNNGDLVNRVIEQLIDSSSNTHRGMDYSKITHSLKEAENKPSK
ncbi:MAG: GAF domain-containing protein [Cyclobacteriaceae bacterium]